MSIEFQITYEDAKKYAKKLNFFQEKQWNEHTKSKNFPEDFPKLPLEYFGRRGEWKSWSDFLGFDPDRHYRFIPFEELKKIVRANKIPTMEEYKIFAKKHNLASNPNQVYEKEWTTFPDFLDTNKVYMSYEEAKKIIKGKCNSRAEFTEFRKNHLEIPSEQHFTTTGEWKTWGDFLGTGYISTTQRKNGYYWSFKKARKFARSLKLSGQLKWELWSRTHKRPNGMPMACSKVYEKEWKGWSNFLGNNNERLRIKKVNFNECKKFAKELKLNSSSEWYKYVKTHKIPDDIPKDPFDLYYRKKTWTNWSDFLNSKIISTTLKHENFLSYNKAKKWARALNFQSSSHWFKFKKANNENFPEGIPRHPHMAYKDNGWKSWGDFLGYRQVPRGSYLEFFEAKTYLRSLKLKSNKDFIKQFDKRKLTKVPRNLYSHYIKCEGFKGIADMLGTQSNIYNFWSFIEARKFVKNLKLQSQTEFFEAKKLGLIPKDIPYTPNRVYAR